MKREILFRGQKIGSKEWVEGSLVENKGRCIIIVKSDYDWIDMLSGNYWGIDAPSFKVIPETVGQFTGLLDKNGKRIFEGDICQIIMRRKYGHQNDGIPAIVGAVSFGRICVHNDTLHLYEAFNINGGSIEFQIGHELEVIGSIHDNPELIK